MSHKCHAYQCNRNVPPRMFMCGPHWKALPRDVQRAIWREYRPGQEIDKQASVSYLAVQAYAIGVLAFKSNDEHAARVTASCINTALNLRERAMGGGGKDPLVGLLPEAAS